MDWYDPPKFGVCDSCGYKIREKDEVKFGKDRDTYHEDCYKNE